MNDVTEILAQIGRGQATTNDQLFPHVYRELRQLAQSKIRNERPDHTLQATALVHEAYLRLIGSSSSPSWDDRGHFFAAAAEAMRRILIESVRQKKTQKRGGELERIELDTFNVPSRERSDKLLALDAALERLEALDPIRANLVKLRFFAGLTQAEAAQALGISVTTAIRYWAFARSWLQDEMKSD